jgi:DNA polymerase
LLDKAVAEAGLARDRVYLTNAVKHFRWIWRGKRRLHQKPSVRQIVACKPWLDAELQVIQPKIVVCMGATAAQAVFGKPVAITKQRGKFIESDARPAAFVTIHPAAIYRHPGREEQEKEYRRFLAEMKMVRRRLATLKAA